MINEIEKALREKLGLNENKPFPDELNILNGCITNINYTLGRCNSVKEMLIKNHIDNINKIIVENKQYNNIATFESSEKKDQIDLDHSVGVKIPLPSNPKESILCYIGWRNNGIDSPYCQVNLSRGQISSIDELKNVTKGLFGDGGATLCNDHYIYTEKFRNGYDWTKEDIFDCIKEAIEKIYNCLYTNT